MDYLTLAWETLSKDLAEFSLQVESLHEKLKDEVNSKNEKEFEMFFDSSHELTKLKKIETLLSGINNVD
jgi:hypothetical protein